jgi:hypothetical protein
VTVCTEGVDSGPDEYTTSTERADEAELEGEMRTVCGDGKEEEDERSWLRVCTLLVPNFGHDLSLEM